MTSIRMHDKHGLNPTLCRCFWCGEETGVIALLGAAYHGKAPKYMVLDTKPCDACKARFAMGILLAEYDPSKVERKAFGKLTGRWVVVSEAFIKRNINETAAKDVLRVRRANVAKRMFDVLLADMEESGLMARATKV